MTTPSLFSAEYGDANALYRAPVVHNGSALHVKATATIPVSTATSVNVGLIPFQKGMRVCMAASSVNVSDGDTGSSASGTLGWVYDDNVTYTNDENGFIASSTIPQTGGIDILDAVAGYSFEAEAPGWIVWQTGGETVEVEYTVQADLVISYK